MIRSAQQIWWGINSQGKISDAFCGKRTTRYKCSRTSQHSGLTDLNKKLGQIEKDINDYRRADDPDKLNHRVVMFSRSRQASAIQCKKEECIVVHTILRQWRESG